MKMYEGVINGLRFHRSYVTEKVSLKRSQFTLRQEREKGLEIIYY